MQVRNNEITVTRGEDWTMSKLIVNKDSSPYIVSSELINPYWLITIKRTDDYNNSYVYNKWLDLSSLPRFKVTQPLNINDYGRSFFEPMPTLPFLDLDENGVSDFTGDETSGYSNIAIFYEKGENGVISYKYWEYNNNEKDDFSGKWVDYSCPIITSFFNSVTKDWVEQNYLYQIRLLSGQTTHEYISFLASYLGVDSDGSLEDLYDAIAKKDNSLIKDVDLSRPLYTIDTNLTILEPTRLTVKLNLNGGTI